MNRVSGKVAPVTGGAEGIGRATAELLAREAAAVIAADLAAEGSFGRGIEYARLDVADQRA